MMLARLTVRPRLIDVSSARGGRGGMRYYRQTFNLSLFRIGRSGQRLVFHIDAYAYKGVVLT